AHNNYVRCAAPWRHDASQHVNVVVSRTTGAINRQEQLPVQSCRIDAAAAEDATHVDRGNLVKNRRLVPDLRIARADAVKHIVKVAFAAKKEISIRGHVQGSQIGRVRNSDGSLPGDPAISGSAELAAAAASSRVPRLILEPVPRAASLIDGKPLLIASTREAVGLQLCPGLATIG